MTRTVPWTLAALLSVAGGAGCNTPASGEPGAMGAKGDKGDKGDPGSMGTMGTMGTMGQGGAMGTPGAKGDPGMTGPQGPAGATGATGPAGPMGMPGPAGPPGATGATGATGPAGSAGPKGDTGAQGPAGAAGPMGPAGATGPAGTAGAPGPQGPPGPAGSGAYSEDLGTFAGFTSTTYRGGLGGRAAAHATCAAAFSGSHLCHAGEFIQANSATPLPASGAWIDPSTVDGSNESNTGVPGSGRMFSYTCNSWTDGTSGRSGHWINTTGAMDTSGDCSASRALACCNTPGKVGFAGFTSSTTNGGVGGRAKMHGLCATAFGGSHMCHANEYIRSNSATTVPASGAWIDPSTVDGSNESNTGVPRGGRMFSYTCNSWNDGTTGRSGHWINTTGAIDTSGDCSASRAIACCN